MDEAALAVETARVRDSGVLGDAKLRQLFDYLAAHPLTKAPPKEITIAIEVFGKTADFDVSQDALVRVYIHKLRRALEEFYAGHAGADVIPLQVPRGEYRLTLKGKLPTPPPATQDLSLFSSWKKLRRAPIAVMALVSFLTAALVLLLMFAAANIHSVPNDAERGRESPIWSAILQDDRPIVIVVGDYYLFGETDVSMEVKRLIREYSVNSKQDLDDYLREHPEFAERYTDVGLHYLPTSAAFALRDIMPILGAGGRRIGLSTMSDVTPAMLKSNNLIYVGYLSGLGIMQQLVFAGSRFKIGDSYDELMDKTTRHDYISQTASRNVGAPTGAGKESAYRDYGYLTRFRGPGGNFIVVMAGTRDEGLRQVTEIAANASKIKELALPKDASQAFEALIEVSALDGVNLGGKTLLQSRR